MRTILLAVVALCYSIAAHAADPPKPETTDASTLPALVKVLEADDSSNWEEAAQAVRKMEGHEAHQAALKLLDHRDARVRAIAIGRFQDKPDARVVAQLAKALKDSDVNVCRQAALALRPTPGEEAKQVILNAFHHPDALVRVQLVCRFIDQPDERVAMQLIEMLYDPHENVRRNTVHALGRSAAMNYPEVRIALFYHGDPELRSAMAAQLKPTLVKENRITDVLLSAEHTLDRMKSFPPIEIATPSAYVEMIGGDRIVGAVVGCSPRSAASESSETLLVQPLQLAVVHPEPNEHGIAAHARVRTRWVRRIVWQPRDVRHYTPGVVFLRTGGQIGFDSLRWEADGIAVLLNHRTKRIALDDIAELHLPNRDPWPAYCEQLAVLGCKPTDKLARLDFPDGSHITTNANRFVPFSNVQQAESDNWQHSVYPAWCIDGLAMPHRTMRLRSRLPSTEVPMFLPLGVLSSTEYWPWHVNRNIRGSRLQSGDREYGWGFGVHADNVLQFTLPPYATGFRTEVGLDHIVRDRGCARPVVRLRVGDSVRELYRGPLLIGSKSVQDTNTVNFAPIDGAAKLELVADSAAREHVRGADPLNIRDMVDWLEPRILLNAEGLSTAIGKAATGLDPVLLERDRVFDERRSKAN